jgi:hypothetical protein
MILTHKEAAAFHMPIFTNLTKIEQHYMQFSYSELSAKRTVNAVSMSRNTVTLLLKVECSFFGIIACRFFLPQSEEL